MLTPKGIHQSPLASPPAHVARGLSSVSQPQTQRLTSKVLVGAMHHISQRPRNLLPRFSPQELPIRVLHAAGPSRLASPSEQKNVCVLVPKPDSALLPGKMGGGKPEWKPHCSSISSSPEVKGRLPSWAQLSTGWGGTFPRISWIVPQWQEAGGGGGEAGRIGVEGEGEGGRSHE